MEYPLSNLDYTGGSSSSESYWQNDQNSQNLPRTRDMIRWKSGKKLDPRLLSLLESFGEIYDERQEFFRKIFGGLYEDLFNKVSVAKKKMKKMKKARSMPRSMSMRARGIDDEIEGLRLERFKVRTPNVAVVGTGDGQSGQTTTQSSQGSQGSK